MSLQWNQDLSVGVNEIDDQHKELINRVNSFFDAMGKGKGREEIEKVVKFLEDYVITHFSTEEKYMAKYGYLDSLAHKAQHKAFIKDFGEIKKKCEDNGTSTHLVIQVQRHVHNWLINHIGKVDKALGAYLKTKL